MESTLKRGIAPEHPGMILRELYVKPLGLTDNKLAENLNVTRVTVNRLLNGKQGVTAEMALRLSKAFGTTPQLWLNMQRNYDLWNVEHTINIEVKRIA